jgi:hypothetical protein
MEEGPGKAGCSGACWRSPMMPPWIDDRFGVLSHVCSIAQWLHNLGWSAQTAAGVAAHLDEDQRNAWCTTTWPQRVRLAKERRALLLFGEAARVPQWGTLPSTWARRGPQPKGKTSGKRQGDTVFGLMESCTGRFLYQGPDGRLHSTAYIALLRRVLEQTTPPIRLIQEGARYHTSTEPKAFFALQTARLQVVQLPT